MKIDTQSQTLLTVPILAERLGVSVKTAWRLVHQRKIGFHRIGRRIAISPKHVDDYLRSIEVVPIDPQLVARKFLGH